MIVKKNVICPECGSINILRRTCKARPTNKELGAGKKFEVKQFFCRRCKKKFG